MTIQEVKKIAKFICEYKDPSGKSINGYYNENDDIYYITYDSEFTRDKQEYVVFKNASDIKDNLLFDPFSEIKYINKK